MLVKIHKKNLSSDVAKNPIAPQQWSASGPSDEQKSIIQAKRTKAQQLEEAYYQSSPGQQVGYS